MYLGKHMLHSVKRESQNVTVVKGAAWITFEGLDWFIEEGESIGLGDGLDEAVISAMGPFPLVYEIS